MADPRDDEPKAPQQPALFDSRGRKQQQRSIDAAERRAAARRDFEALPDAAREAIWQRVDRLLLHEAVWVRAKSPEYATNPHSYCHRKRFRDDADFWFLIEFFRSGICDREKYHGRWYDVLNRGGRKYWCMNWPLDLGGKWCTVIINKKPVEPGDR
jgi:hypothetical protein